LFNLNLNNTFNQTFIFSIQPQLKVLFIKYFFSNYNHNNYRNTKHTRIPNTLEIAKRNDGKVTCPWSAIIQSSLRYIYHNFLLEANSVIHEKYPLCWALKLFWVPASSVNTRNKMLFVKLSRTMWWYSLNTSITWGNFSRTLIWSKFWRLPTCIAKRIFLFCFFFFVEFGVCHFFFAIHNRLELICNCDFEALQFLYVALIQNVGSSANELKFPT